MPFTPTHIAAILPFSWLASRRLPFSALAIGSMIPDLPLFLPSFLVFDYSYTHSILGTFLICVPLGMTMFLWFQCLLKEPLAELLPDWIRQRLRPHDRANLQTSYSFFALVSLAILIGAATHVFWDSFTHYQRWGYRQFPNMNRIVFQWGDYSLEFYKALQHGSTVVLVPLMTVGIIYWLRQQPPLAGPTLLSRRARCAWAAALLAMPNLLALLWCAFIRQRFVSVGDFAREAVTTAGLGFFLMINAYAIYVRRLPDFVSTQPR